MILQGQAFTCTASAKSFRFKELSNLTTSFSPETFPSQESLILPAVFNRFSPFSEALAAQSCWIFVSSQTDRFFCEHCWRAKEPKRQWTREDQRDRATGAWDICFHFVLWPLSGRVEGQPFINWITWSPSPVIKALGKYCYGVTRDFRKCRRKSRHVLAFQVTSLVQMTSFMCINSNLFLTFFKYPPRSFSCRQP